ncbi:MAG: isochorismatase family protein [Phycisphaerae bacterium]
MIRGRNGRAFDCILVDLNTQQDFCASDGIHPVANLEALIPALRRTIAWAKRNGIPVVSCVESCRESDVFDGMRRPCCVDGTRGQRKLDFTLLGRHAVVEVDNTLTCPVGLFRDFQQIIFRKRGVDLLDNPKADRFFNTVLASEFIVFGIGIEGAVKALTLGLIARRKQVTIVHDASGYWSKATADQALQQVAAKGARVINVCQLATRRLSWPRRYRWSRRVTASRPAGPDGNGSGNGHGRTGANGNGRGAVGGDGMTRPVEEHDHAGGEPGVGGSGGLDATDQP